MRVRPEFLNELKVVYMTSRLGEATGMSRSQHKAMQNLHATAFRRTVRRLRGQKAESL